MRAMGIHEASTNTRTLVLNRLLGDKGERGFCVVDYFPLIASAISIVFAVLVGIQYLRRRKRHQLIWTVALIMFSLTSLLGFVSQPEIIGGNIALYRLYYLLAAPMVALLGTGTLYLLTHKPFGLYSLIYVAIVFIPFAMLVLTASIDPNTEIKMEGTTITIHEAFKTNGFDTIGGAAMPQNVRVLSPFFTVPGSIFLIGGALYSFWLDRTRTYSLLIALGGIFFSLGGAMQRFGNPVFMSFLHTIGILLLFIGFIMSREYTKKRLKP